MNPASSPVVHAVVVAFNPDAEVLRALLAQLVRQTARVHLVDNTPGGSAVASSAGFPHGESVRLRVLGENFGLATALNIGIADARAAGAAFVLLSDQDSKPSDDMVGQLHQAYQALAGNGLRVGAVGPVYIDLNTGLAMPFQVEIPGRFFYGHVRPRPEDPPVAVIGLITSGTLLPIAVIDDVGGMRDEFFIDYVDVEWCHRARAKGWRLYGCGQARMEQALGERGMRVWYLGWRAESAYPPQRVYYRVRNFLRVCVLSPIGWRWKLRHGWYTLGVVYSQTVFGSHRLKALGASISGVVDGVLGRMGPRPL
jgi:rhamnosyltransferase